MRLGENVNPYECRGHFVQFLTLLLKKPGPVTAWALTPSLKTPPPTTMSLGCQGPGRATRAPVLD